MVLVIRKIKPDVLIDTVKEKLAKLENIKPPEVAMFVKSGACCERPPQQPDFWYIRTAALLRKVYLNGPVGVERMRNAFGGRRRRGHKPAHHRKAGGKFIRLMFQQLEKEGLVKRTKKGRQITAKGQKFLNDACREVINHENT